MPSAPMPTAGVSNPPRASRYGKNVVCTIVPFRRRHKVPSEPAIAIAVPSADRAAEIDDEDDTTTGVDHPLAVRWMSSTVVFPKSFPTTATLPCPANALAYENPGNEIGINSDCQPPPGPGK